MKWQAALGVAAFGCAAAQGEILELFSQGRWDYRLNPAEVGRADWQFRTFHDYLDRQWWWIRDSPDAGESMLSGDPDLIEVMDQRHGRIFWEQACPDVANLSAELRVSISSAHCAEVRHDLVLRNTGSSAITLWAFGLIDTNDDGPYEYADGNGTWVDVSTNFGLGTTVHAITDGAAWLVGEDVELFELMQDAAPTECGNTGLPFGPGQFAIVYQWNNVIDPGESWTLSSVYWACVPGPATSAILLATLLRWASRRR